MFPESNCLLCYRTCTISAATLSADSKLERKSLLGDQVAVIFVLRKLLEIPQSFCETLLLEIGNPDGWITNCKQCTDLVDKAHNTFKKMTKLENKFEDLKNKIYQILANSKGVNCPNATNSRKTDEIRNLVFNGVGMYSDCHKDGLDPDVVIKTELTGEVEEATDWFTMTVDDEDECGQPCFKTHNVEHTTCNSNLNLSPAPNESPTIYGQLSRAAGLNKLKANRTLKQPKPRHWTLQVKTEYNSEEEDPSIADKNPGTDTEIPACKKRRMEIQGKRKQNKIETGKHLPKTIKGVTKTKQIWNETEISEEEVMKLWKLRQSYSYTDRDVVYYICKERNRKCPAKLKHVKMRNPNKLTKYYVNELQHVHPESATNRGLTEIQKSAIRQLINENRLIAPNSVIQVLKSQGIKIPDKLQIKNFMHYTLKKLFPKENSMDPSTSNLIKQEKNTETETRGKSTDSSNANESNNKHADHLASAISKEIKSQNGVSENNTKKGRVFRFRHKRKMPCDQCEVSYSTINALKRHILQMHTDLPYKCEHCDKKCQTTEAVAKHISRIHKNKINVIKQTWTETNVDEEEVLKMWKYRKTYNYLDRDVTYFTCKDGGKHCFARLKCVIVLAGKCTTYYLNEQEHTHPATMTQRGLTEIQKTAILQLLQDDPIIAPNSVIQVLKSRSIDIPEKIKLVNFMHYTSKKMYPKSCIT